MYTRRKEEGYNLPDPRYRQWLASGTDTAGSTSVPTSSKQRLAFISRTVRLSNWAVRASEGKEMGLVRPLSAVVSLSVRRDSPQMRQGEDVQVSCLHPAVLTISPQCAVVTTHASFSACRHFVVSLCSDF